MPVINPAIRKIIASILTAEGGYVNDSSDAGGETNLGITIATARRNGYKGSMRNLTVDQASEIYYNEYVVKVGFDHIVSISEKVGAEVIDTGVNLGCQHAGKILQRTLNILSGSLLDCDGAVGPATLSALSSYIGGNLQREAALVKALNCMQGSFYLELAEKNQSQRKFLVGWLNNRVTI